ncbi:hypothetical protein BC830DRAFT_918800 [Chytriomyces sp. MP71]|nr:hypothetical protein BC830DRAFT_918800 [Chytriomyces sp. MP71]
MWKLWNMCIDMQLHDWIWGCGLQFTSDRPVRTSGSTCTCDTGFTGINCNICTASQNCKVEGSDNPICNTTPKVYKSGSIQCVIIQPVLQAAYPGTSLVTLDRTLSSQSTLGALWYNNNEQFSCLMKSCNQFLNNGLYSWYCQSLSCTCTGASTFCGPLRSSVNAAYVSFLQSFFPQGLPLQSCSFGECASQSNNPSLLDVGSKGLTAMQIGGVSAGAAVIAIFLAGQSFSLDPCQ